MSNMVLELLGTVWGPQWTVPNGSLPIPMTCNLYSMQWQRNCIWHNPVGNVTHSRTQSCRPKPKHGNEESTLPEVP
jgi:hypothetical protein